MRVSVIFTLSLAVAGCAAGDGSRTVTPQPTPTPANPGEWSAPAAVHAMGGSSTKPALAVDASGNALVVFEHRADGQNEQGVWASRHESGGWSTPVLLAGGYDYVWTVQLAGNAEGSALAAWVAQDAGSVRVFASRFDLAEGWRTAEVLGEGDSVQVAVGDDGHALAAWRSGDGSAGESLQVRLHHATDGWSAAQALVTGNIASGWWETAYRGVFDITIDPAGRLLAAWAQDGAASEVWTRSGSLAPGSVGPLSWEPAMRISTHAGPGVVPVLEVAVDESGSASAIWMHLDESFTSYALSMSTTYGGEWKAPAELAGPIAATYGFFSNVPRLAVNRAGEWIALWREEKDETKGRVLATRFTPGSGWSDVAIVSDDQEQPMGCTFEGTAEGIHLSLGDDGRALVVWEERAPGAQTIGLGATESIGGNEWSPRVTLEPAASGMAQTPLTASSAKAGFSAWVRSGPAEDGGWTDELWASRLEPIPPS